MIIDFIAPGALLLTLGFVGGYRRFRLDFVKGFEAGVKAGADAATQRTNRAIDEMCDYLGIDQLTSLEDAEQVSR